MIDNKMDLNALKNLDRKELFDLLKSLQKKLYASKLEIKSTGDIKDTSVVGKCKRNIARVLTEHAMRNNSYIVGV